MPKKTVGKLVISKINKYKSLVKIAIKIKI